MSSANDRLIKTACHAGKSCGDLSDGSFSYNGDTFDGQGVLDNVHALIAGLTPLKIDYTGSAFGDAGYVAAQVNATNVRLNLIYSTLHTLLDKVT